VGESALEQAGNGVCEGIPLAGYRYGDPPGFWLGEQGETPLSVRGAGYLVSRADDAGESIERFSTEVQLSVGPDGSLEDAGGDPLLGYAPERAAGGPCVTPLRAPLFAPAEATTPVSFSLNLDPYNPVWREVCRGSLRS